MVDFSEKDYLNIRFTDFFEDFNYVPFKAWNQYRKTQVNGFTAAVILPTFYERSMVLEVNVAVRINKIESIVNQFLPGRLGNQEQSLTCILPLYTFDPHLPLRFTIHSMVELNKALSQVFATFRASAFQFLDNYGQLSKTAELLNLEKSLFPGMAYNRFPASFRALTAARLTHLPEFLNLAETSRNELLAHQTPDLLLKKFDNLVLYLQHYSEN